MWKKISDLTNKKTKSTNISQIKEDGVLFSTRRLYSVRK
jgi:hypothetical protein